MHCFDVTRKKQMVFFDLNHIFFGRVQKDGFRAAEMYFLNIIHDELIVLKIV